MKNIFIVALTVFILSLMLLKPAGTQAASVQAPGFLSANATSSYVPVRVPDATQVALKNLSAADEVAPDPLYAKQDYLRQINLPPVWSEFDSGREIVVAVIDNGIYLDHPDLANRIWTNRDEVAGNGLDDDGNGYIDDVNGWNFVDDSHDLTPVSTHGTQVAGIIAAEHGNGVGMKGVNPQARLMPLLVASGDGSVRKFAKAVYYAVDNGAQVINLSFSTRGFNGFLAHFDEAVRYAYEHGVIIVAAAGNGDGHGQIAYDLDQIPQSPVCNEGDQNMVIGVGALDQDGQPAKWSNYGSYVDVWVPGQKILSITDPDKPDEFRQDSGTSLSAPIVTGLVSMIKAHDPTISTDQVVNLLKESAANNLINAYQIFSQL